jgi:glutaredoxin
MSRTALFLAGIFLAVATAGAQDMYKWVDAQGNVTYQDQPPPGQEDDAAPFAKDTEVAAELVAEKARQSITSSVPVTLYSVPICDACDLVRIFLEKNGVPYTERDADQDPAAQKEMKDLTGQLSVPLLVIGDNVVNGYSSTAMKSQLINAGYTLGGEAASGQEGQPAESPLSEAEIAEQATAAAAKLTADLDELTKETSRLDDLDATDEIPEDEQIKVRISE